MPRGDASEGGGRGGDPKVVEVPVLEVDSGAAMRADKVVMRGDVGVETDLTAQEPDRGHEAELREESQGPINGVERNVGHRPEDFAMDGFDVGVGGCRGHVTVDLEALGSDLDPGATENGLEMGPHLSDLVR